jgi:hypothetical protein
VPFLIGFTLIHLKDESADHLTEAGEFVKASPQAAAASSSDRTSRSQATRAQARMTVIPIGLMICELLFALELKVVLRALLIAR